MNLVLGLDPGVNTGVATFVDGVLVELQTIPPHHIERLLREKQPLRVIYEDSRIESKLWTSSAYRGVALKMARNVGQIDAWCSLIAAVCEELSIPAHGISPTRKGAKLNAKQFAAVTGWEGRSNSHERDGAMVAFPYRNMVR